MSRPDLLRRRASDVLTVKQYDAWKLVVFDGFPKKQAARILRVTPATLKGHLDAADVRLYADERFRDLVLLEAGRAQ